MYVNNANHVRKGYNAQDVISDLNRLKAAAEARMAAYDKLPKAAREAVNEFGQLPSAVRCKSRKASDKVKAIKMAYVKKLEKTSTLLEA